MVKAGAATVVLNVVGATATVLLAATFSITRGFLKEESFKRRILFEKADWTDQIAELKKPLISIYTNKILKFFWEQQ